MPIPDKGFRAIHKAACLMAVRTSSFACKDQMGIIAWHIPATGHCRDASFVDANCGALPEDHDQDGRSFTHITAMKEIKSWLTKN